MKHEHKLENEKWFKMMTSFLKEGKHLMIPNSGVLLTLSNGKLKTDAVGYNSVREIVTEKWFNENIELTTA
jgi:hypothetical protein